MKTLNTIIALLLCSTLIGQTKTFYNTKTPNGDSTFWYKTYREIARKLSLPLLDISLKAEYVRIWTSSQAIDIWQDETGTFSGILTTWTDEYPPYNEEPTNRTFVSKKQINHDTAAFLAELINSTRILTIPTDDSIAGWHQGFDGIIYLIEYSTKSSYSFKSYWTPKSQTSLKEAFLVQSFVDKAFTLAGAQNTWDEFAKQIPFESYYNGGPGSSVRILTAEERKKYRRERQNYRRQQAAKGGFKKDKP
jgi:hypothetical protein